MIYSVFGEGATPLAPKGALKDPNMYKESIIFDTISRLPRKKIDEFCASKEAKIMINEGLVSQATLERLAKEHGVPGIVKTMACHMAREDGDPAFAEFVDANRKAHLALQEILDKYCSDAAPVAQNYADELDKIIPDYFKK